MKITLFSVEEANRLLPRLHGPLTRLIDFKREHDRALRQAEVLSVATAGASGGNPDVSHLRRERGRVARLAEQIGAEVAAIQRHGCLVKGLDEGLVDFYSLLGDRLIFLCWKLGEAEVAHWHGLEAGFSGRQPLQWSESD